MTTANTRECFQTFRGQRLTGLLFNALPLNRRDLSAGTKALVFEDGRALVIHGNGSFYVESAREVQRAIDRKAKELETTATEIRDVITLAGHIAESAALPSPVPPT